MKKLFALILSFVVLLTGCTDPPKFKSTDITGSDWGKDFALTDHNGTPRQLADFRGKVLVVFFGYTQCPDVCPTTLASMRDVLGLLGEDAKRVQVLFITLDPARDSSELLAHYVPAFHPSFLGLRGDDDATAAVAKEFKVFYSKQKGSTPDNYSVDHSTGSYVFDPNGRLRLLLRHGEAPEIVAGDLKLLLANSKTPAVVTGPAEINLEIGTPPVMVARHALTQRSSRLVRFYEAGIIGLGNDGMVKMRDGSHLTLVQRQIAEKLIDQENPDRNSLIYALAEAHGGKAVQPAARAAQVKRWKDQFHSGWWIEEANGNWSKKP